MADLTVFCPEFSLCWPCCDAIPSLLISEPCYLWAFPSPIPSHSLARPWKWSTPWREWWIKNLRPVIVFICSELRWWKWAHISRRCAGWSESGFSVCVSIISSPVEVGGLCSYTSVPSPLSSAKRFENQIRTTNTDLGFLTCYVNFTVLAWKQT